MKKNKIGIFALISIVLIVLVLILTRENYSKSIGNLSPTKYQAGGSIIQGEKDPAKYSYNIYTGIFNATTFINQKEWVPVYKDFQLYCIYPGEPIKYGQGISYNDAKELEGKTSYATSGHASTYMNGKVTRPRYYPVKNKDDKTITYKLPVAAAYIISDEPIGKYTSEKQRGIWNLRYSIVKETGKPANVNEDGIELILGDGSGYEDDTDTSSKYDTVAIDYANHDAKVRNKGLGVTNKTNDQNVTISIDQSKDEYTIGPFKVNYTSGIYGKVAFSGISNIVAYGYNADGKLVKNNIKVEKITVKNKSTGKYGSSFTPEYFTPDKTLKIDKTSQKYPSSGQEFKVIIKDPNEGISANDPNKVTNIKVKVEFKYMLANGKYTKIKGVKYKVYYKHTHNVSGYSCITKCELKEISQQPIMAADAIRTLYKQELIIGTGSGYGLSINLGGNVWEDTVATKESKADGVMNTTGENPDIRLKNIKVTLYEEDGTLAKLTSNANENGISNEELMHRINPTYTDDKGQYMFEGLDPMKRYYVVFEYNGQRYLPTEYLNTKKGQYKSVQEIVNAGLYGKEEWKVTSKALEKDGTANVKGVEISREDFDKRFEEIGSYPYNYKSTNSLGWANGGYNPVYTQIELMGYKLTEDGKYVQSEKQLVDGFKYDENGLETKEYSEGEISKKVREYIQKNKKFPDDKAMKVIYEQIAGNNEELKMKLQFVEDTYIQSYTRSLNNNKEVYPVAGKNNRDELYINLGLWRRPEFDMALRKDVYKATLKINNKTVTYNYEKGTTDDAYWDINVRMSDYQNYYNLEYNRELYRTDYEYKTTGFGSDHPGNPLDVYITYKITLRNQSQSIMGQIREVVDYYDKDYTFRNDLSWVTYSEGDKGTGVSNDEFYNAMVAEKISGISNARDIKSSQNSRYGKDTESDIKDNLYNAVYISGLENKKLASGESAYIYLTFEVNKDSDGKVILDNDSSPKQNLVEINGHKTYYKDGTKLPNGVTKNSKNIAGLIDRDSTPGNLVSNDLQGEKYEKNFEDDTDRAPALRLVIDDDAVRKANGTVWEDERTKNVNNSIIGDGIRQDEEIGVSGATVQLVEKCTDGSEYIWQETITDSKGKYNFEKFIPGDYVVRFYYGDKEVTALTSKEQPISYNGQDFKSTIYQSGIKQSGKTDLAGKYNAYTDTEKQNESGTYGYDIYKADSNKNNLSDAKDIWSTNNRDGLKISGPVNSARLVQGREEVINYSAKDITNHKAEVLASPYQRPSYNGTEYSDEEMNALYKELMDETYMTAETGVIDVEFEYDRQQSDGIKSTENNKNNSSKDYVGDNKYNSNYSLNNIDFGLTERPKAQLEMDKSVANVKVTLANGSILFDINGSANNALWQDHEEYDLEKHQKDGKYEEYYNKKNKHRYSYRDEIDKLIKDTDNGLIQLTMDEELMHGATIQVTYSVKITNVGEVDYVDDKTKDFYYNAEILGADEVKTTAGQVVDFVQNNLQFDATKKENVESGWAVKNKNDLLSENLINGKLTDNLNKFNTLIQTESFNTSPLKPGEEISKTLILTQLITPENEQDDLTYSNMAEIVKTSNDVGRRMAYSVVGNQDPTLNGPSEVDTSVAEKIVILPPFGQARIYYLVGAIVAIILIGGIILIRRKVIKDKENK